MSDSKSSGSSLGFSGFLTLIFITLKLTNFINWSWWWVLSPVWITFGFVAVILAAALAFSLIALALKKK